MWNRAKSPERPALPGEVIRLGTLQRPRAFVLLLFHTPKFSPNRERRWFLFFLPNWALWAPNRPGTGVDGSFPHLGPKLATQARTGRVLGRCGLSWLSQVERLLCVLLLLPKGCKKAKSHGTLLRNHTRCRGFQGCGHQMSKCPLPRFAPLHSYCFLCQFHSLACRTDST